jgi:hypothetical protein
MNRNNTFDNNIYSKYNHRYNKSTRYKIPFHLRVPHHLQTLNRLGLPENSVAAEVVAEHLAAFVLLEWDLVSGALVVSVVVFAVNGS